jgi:hypothetical protein
MKPNPAVLRQFKRDRAAARRDLSKQYENTRQCNEFYAGDFISYRDRIKTKDGVTAMVQINKVQPFVNAVVGFMTQNRSEANYLARVPEEVKQKAYTQYANALKGYVRENANFDQVEAAQNHDLVVCGYGAVETAMSWDGGQVTTEPEGEIIGSELDSESVWWDPNARKKNLLDRKFCGYDKVLDLDEAMELMDAEESAFETVNSDDQGGYKAVYDQGSYRAERFVGDFEWADDDQTQVRMSFYQWYDIEPYWIADNPLFQVADPQMAEFYLRRMELIGEEADPEYKFDPMAERLVCDAKTKSALEELFPEMKFYGYKRKCFYQAVISGETVFKAHKLISQQGYTIKFKTGYFDKKKKIWFGLVNAMMEPVLYYNKSLTELMYIIGSNSKGGVMYETGAVKDGQEFEANYAKTSAAIEVEDGALVNGKIKPKREPYTPTGYEQIIQITDQAFYDAVGLDKTFFGITDDESGILFRRRVKQAMTILAVLFDAIALYQKEHARVLLDMLRVLVEHSDGKAFHAITGAGKPEFMVMAYDRLAAEYAVTIQEGPESTEDREIKGAKLFGMGDKLLAVGDPAGKQVYAISAKYLNLDAEDQQKLTEVLSGQQIDPQAFALLQQQVQQLTSRSQQLQDKLIESGIELNKARVDETMSKVQKTVADTVLTVEKTEQTALETAMARRSPSPDGVRVSI